MTSNIIDLDFIFQILGQKDVRVRLLEREMALVIRAKDKEIKELKEKIEELKKDIDYLNQPEEVE